VVDYRSTNSESTRATTLFGLSLLRHTHTWKNRGGQQTVFTPRPKSAEFVNCAYPVRYWETFSRSQPANRHPRRARSRDLHLSLAFSATLWGNDGTQSHRGGNFPRPKPKSRRHRTSGAATTMHDSFFSGLFNAIHKSSATAWTARWGEPKQFISFHHARCELQVSHSSPRARYPRSWIGYQISACVSFAYAKLRQDRIANRNSSLKIRAGKCRPKGPKLGPSRAISSSVDRACPFCCP